LKTLAETGTQSRPAIHFKRNDIPTLIVEHG
jgi:hypothetical protein